MGSISLDVKDLERKFHARKVLMAIDLEEAFKSKLSAEHGKASGALQAGIRVEVRGDYLVVLMEDYWKYLEYGTPPHMPPVDELENWVKIKFGLVGPEANAIAWAVSMHIKKYGTQAFPFVRETLRLDYPKILKKAMGG